MSNSPIAEGPALRAFLRDMPPDAEIDDLLLSLTDEKHIPLALDRYVVIIAAAALEGALHHSLVRHGVQNPPSSFGRLIQAVYVAQIITQVQRDDLITMKDIRNTFAHHVDEKALQDEDLLSAINLIRSFPITDWRAYFLPAFPPRVRFALLCKQFRILLLQR